jgi:hypothetical protein
VGSPYGHEYRGREGDYIADLRNLAAVAPVYDAANKNSFLCLTSMYDVLKFVVQSLNITHWPAELSMRGDRISANALIEFIQKCRGIISPMVYLSSLLMLLRPSNPVHCLARPSRHDRISGSVSLHADHTAQIFEAILGSLMWRVFPLSNNK